jgi:hypothetical protein
VYNVHASDEHVERRNLGGDVKGFPYEDYPTGW